MWRLFLSSGKITVMSAETYICEQDILARIKSHPDFITETRSWFKNGHSILSLTDAARKKLKETPTASQFRANRKTKNK